MRSTSPLREIPSVATKTRKRPKLFLVATLSVAIFWSLVMAALLNQSFSLFPVVEQSTDNQGFHFFWEQHSAPIRLSHNNHNQEFGIHEAATAMAFQNASIFETKVQNPPRVVTCKCYAQVKKAFLARGFRINTKKNNHNSKDSLIIWRPASDMNVMTLEAWQRPNHFPGESFMDRKGAMYQVLRQYSSKKNVSLPFLPETFVLYDETDRKRFLDRLSPNGGDGMHQPWVLKQTRASRGRGVTMLGPNSDNLRTLRDMIANNINNYNNTANNSSFAVIKRGGHIVQSYIQNVWTFQGHKCDFRVFALVASVDPLVVLYHDGIARTTSGLHDQDNFNNSQGHLTNRWQNQGNPTLWDPVKTFGQLEDELNHYMARDDVTLDIKDPMAHIRNQMKEILGIVFASFQSRLNLNQLPIDNAFSLMGADFAIDNDLKVWLLEMQLGPDLQSYHHKGVSAILQDILQTTIDLVEEVYQKQTKNEPLLPLENMGNFDLVYFDQSPMVERVRE